MPLFLIPYAIPVTFNKSLNNLYITFEYKHWDNKQPYGTISQNFGPVDEINNFYEFWTKREQLCLSINSNYEENIISSNAIC